VENGVVDPVDVEIVVLLPHVLFSIPFRGRDRPFEVPAVLLGKLGEVLRRHGVTKRDPNSHGW
jgi:hypothetical protein